MVCWRTCEGSQFVEIKGEMRVRMYACARVCVPPSARPSYVHVCTYAGCRSFCACLCVHVSLCLIRGTYAAPKGFHDRRRGKSGIHPSPPRTVKQGKHSVGEPLALGPSPASRGVLPFSPRLRPGEMNAQSAATILIKHSG